MEHGAGSSLWDLSRGVLASSSAVETGFDRRGMLRRAKVSSAAANVKPQITVTCVARAHSGYRVGY